jgi:hypothetical protein
MENPNSRNLGWLLSEGYKPPYIARGSQAPQWAVSWSAGSAATRPQVTPSDRIAPASRRRRRLLPTYLPGQGGQLITERMRPEAIMRAVHTLYAASASLDGDEEDMIWLTSRAPKNRIRRFCV